MKTKLLSLALVSSLGLAGCGSSDDNDPVALDIVETAQSDDRFDTLVAAVTAADLVGTLQGDGPFTVFAPTDAAFATYLEENNLEATDLLASDQLANILTYHVYAGEVLASSAISIAGSDNNIVDMVNEGKLALSLSGDDLYANLSQVTVTDVQASNGVIHAIDKVLTPQADSALSNTDRTIAELVTDISTGSTDEFNVLLEAVVAAELDDDLAGAGPFTVFAPTDAAFTALLSALNIEKADLLADRPNLDNILLQHVIGSEIDSVTAFAANGADVQTLNPSEKVTVSIVDGDLTIEGAKVVITDVKASNGVIHVIDTVIAETDTPAP
jgi:uncharacterized surface protein with fasciclin (FAS1) repeats